jgi:hypothetical protein
MRKLELRGLIAPGAEVCDLEGEHVGTVARVHAANRVPPVVGGGDAAEDVVEVRAGFLGRKHLYVPVSAVLDAGRDGVMLGLRKRELDRRDWGTRPAYLDQAG